MGVCLFVWLYICYTNASSFFDTIIYRTCMYYNFLHIHTSILILTHPYKYTKVIVCKQIYCY